MAGLIACSIKFGCVSVEVYVDEGDRNSTRGDISITDIRVEYMVIKGHNGWRTYPGIPLIQHKNVLKACLVKELHNSIKFLYIAIRKTVDCWVECINDDICNLIVTPKPVVLELTSGLYKITAKSPVSLIEKIKHIYVLDDIILVETSDNKKYNISGFDSTVTCLSTECYDFR